MNATPSALLGWGLALAALVLGWLQYGWQGVVLALSVIVFWLLLQFSRALRVLRVAGSRPIGEVANAVMLNAKLARGQRLVDVLRVTRSLGQAVEPPPVGSDEAFAWHDAGGDRVEVLLRGGRVQSWRLERAAAPEGGR